MSSSKDENYTRVSTPKAPSIPSEPKKLELLDTFENVTRQSVSSVGSGALDRSSLFKTQDQEKSTNTTFDPIAYGEQYPQLTFKSLLVGGIVGTFNAVLAMYYGLRTGVTPSLNVLAGLGGFMLMQAMMKITFKNSTFTVQENAVIQTCAVATYSMASGAGFASGLLALTQDVHDYVVEKGSTRSNPNDVIDLTWLRSFGWCISVALFGFFIAFPLRKNMIIKQKLLFPSGTATATMIEALHSSKESAAKQWNILMKSGGLSYFWLLLLWFFKGIREFPIFGLEASEWGWYLEFGPGVAAIGFMLPFSVMWSILAGALVVHAIMGPLLMYYHEGKDPSDWFVGKGYDGLAAYTVFSAIAIILVDAIYSILKVGYSIYKSFNEKQHEEYEDEEDLSVEQKKERKLIDIFCQDEIPQYIWIGGLIFFGIFSIVMISAIYPVSWYQVLVATLLTPIFSIGIIQGTGLTDWNVSSAVGKLIMFVFGSWSSTSIIPPLILCQATIIGCGQASDLMQDFRTGYLVGASPKAMYYSQFIGAILSCFIVPTVWVMMNAAYDIPGSLITAPFGPVYRLLAIIAVDGLGSLPQYCGYFMLGFALWALITNIFMDLIDVEKYKWVRFIPSPMAFSIGMIVPAYFSLEGIIVGIIGLVWQYKNEKGFKDSRYILASGMMAGEGMFVLTEIIFTFIGWHPPVKVSY